MDKDKLEAGFRLVLEGLGLDSADPLTADSARLTAEAWHDELAAGLRLPEPEFHLFPVEEGQSRGLVALQNIPVKSICAHHLLPFVGEATVAYVPDAQLCGISNLSRMVDHCARKPQVQETLTDEIAERLMHKLRPQGIGVSIRATHHCVLLRGVNHPAVMTTHSLTGCMRDNPELRSEFMALSHPAVAT